MRIIEAGNCVYCGKHIGDGGHIFLCEECRREQMIDREKVIDGLKRCNHYNTDNHCDGCPYRKANGILSWCIDDLMRDAVTLLKEQSDEINRLNRELDAMNRLSEMQMEALQEAEHDDA